MRSVIRDVLLVDGSGADPNPGIDVAIADGRITEVGRGLPPDPDDVVVDGSGLLMTPGLIDAHVHLGLALPLELMSAGHFSLAEIAAAMFRNCEQTLAAGFTTVRDMGGVDYGLVRVVESGTVPGPRILPAVAMICQTGGHGHFAQPWEPIDYYMMRDFPGLLPLGAPVDGVAEMMKAARECFRRGAKFLKLAVSGGVISRTDEVTDTQLTEAEIRAAVGEASARSTYVTVHSHNTESMRTAIRAGVKGIEHGTTLDEETASLMAEGDVSMVPTLTVARLLVENPDAFGLPPQIAARIESADQQMKNAILLAKEAGVRVGSGSDLLGPVQNHRGMELFLRSQITDPLDAITAATGVNADIIGKGHEIGRIAPGYVADLVLWAENPMESPALFDDPSVIHAVYKDGIATGSHSMT